MMRGTPASNAATTAVRLVESCHACTTSGRRRRKLPDDACERRNLRLGEVLVDHFHVEEDDVDARAIQGGQEEVAAIARRQGDAEQRQVEIESRLAQPAQHGDELPFGAARRQGRADRNDAARYRFIGHHRLSKLPYMDEQLLGREDRAGRARPATERDRVVAELDK
jgi:hypothetical protein